MCRLVSFDKPNAGKWIRFGGRGEQSISLRHCEAQGGLCEPRNEAIACCTGRSERYSGAIDLNSLEMASSLAKTWY